MTDQATEAMVAAEVLTEDAVERLETAELVAEATDEAANEALAIGDEETAEAIEDEGAEVVTELVVEAEAELEVADALVEVAVADEMVAEAETLEEATEELAVAEALEAEAEPEPEPEPAAEPEPEREPATAPAAQSEGGRESSAYVTPLVRKMAAQHGVDLAAVVGTGVGEPGHPGRGPRRYVGRPRCSVPVAAAWQDGADVAAAQGDRLADGGVAPDDGPAHHGGRGRRHLDLAAP
jgi:hypothetical protein